MSKSLDNYIGIDESSEVMYEKAMKIPDEVLIDYFRLTTDIDLKEAENLIRENIVKAHKRYAEEIVGMYHGEDKIAVAEERYRQVAKGGIPENIPVFKLENNEKINICELLIKVGFASSKSEAKRMVIGRGVKVDGEIIEDISTTLKPKEKFYNLEKINS